MPIIHCLGSLGYDLRRQLSERGGQNMPQCLQLEMADNVWTICRNRILHFHPHLRIARVYTKDEGNGSSKGGIKVNGSIEIKIQFF